MHRPEAHVRVAKVTLIDDETREGELLRRERESVYCVNA